MMRAFHLVESEGAPPEFEKLVDRLSLSMGKLGGERPDVVQLAARVMWAQHPGFHGACASLNYSEAEMLRRDLRGANNPTLGMFLLRLIERPQAMRDALEILASAAGCRLVVDEAPVLAVHEAKAELQMAHASLQALIDRSFADGQLNDTERSGIRSKLVEVTDRVARVGRSITPEGGKAR